MIVHAEDGAVGGLEGLAFGVLVFVFGMLLILSAWSVIDTKLAVSSAAREAVRTYVETVPGEDPMQRATGAASAALAAYGKDPADPGLVVHAVDDAGLPLAGSPPLERCVEVRLEVEYPADLYLPYSDRVIGNTASATAAELVDPLRSGLNEEAVCVDP